MFHEIVGVPARSPQHHEKYGLGFQPVISAADPQYTMWSAPRGNPASSYDTPQMSTAARNAFSDPSRFVAVERMSSRLRSGGAQLALKPFNPFAQFATDCLQDLNM